MSLELFTPPPSYTISGIGPYNVPHPYTANSLQLIVILASTRAALTPGTDFSVSPLAGETGDILLSGSAATAYDGWKLYIVRATQAQQGWLGTQGAREKGLERQLDLITMVVQEIQQQLGNSLRTERSLTPFAPQDGQTIIFENGNPVPGPTADAITGANEAGNRAEAAAVGLENAEANAVAAAALAQVQAAGIGTAPFADTTAFEGADLPGALDYTSVLIAGERVLYKREPGANGPQDLHHPDGSDWAKASVTQADFTAALADALAGIEQEPAGITFLPTVTFATPGTLAVTYTTQRGWAQKWGDLVTGTIALAGTLTKGTASGNLRVDFAAMPNYAPGANAMGTGQLRAKNAQLVPPAGTIELPIVIPPASKYAEFGYFTSTSGMNYLTTAHVTDGAFIFQFDFSFEV